MKQAVFRDRVQAGRALAEALEVYAGRPDLLVLALPRGGVPVGFEVAMGLGAPLDVFLVRKLGVPGHEELAMGAIASGGVRVLNQEVVEELGIPQSTIEAVAQRESVELDRRELEYRDGRPAPEIRGRTIVLVDDGLATGSTMRAAAAALRTRSPATLIVAVPVGAAEACQALRREVTRVVCLSMPEPFVAVGAWFTEFAETSDGEVRDLLARAARVRGGAEAMPNR